ncbi:hypothetical protein LTR86_005643 [Recurvomyces mirabilis]|nr:hypothetical protein LTR86_005643 [Recurvomyces mirabilis]
MTALTVATTLTTHTSSETRPIDFDFSSHRSFSAPKTTRFTRWTEQARAPSSSGRDGSSVSSRMSLGMGTERSLQQDDARTSTTASRPQSWLRRLSSNMSASRESSRTPTSRPGSAAVPHSNGYHALSHDATSAPMLTDLTPLPVQRNKLVKRSSSLRSTAGSLSSPSGSRLPLPVFKRPATSHQRAATLQDLQAEANHEQHTPASSDARDPAWEQYFTPKIARDDDGYERRRSSTGIPNPVRRIYPDRKYTPVLVSAKELVRRADVEMDDGIDLAGEGLKQIGMQPSVASSPIPNRPAHLEPSAIPRRSFSIGDLLSTGPSQPIWRRSGSNKNKGTTTRLPRKARARVVSAPQSSMGSSLSSTERPAKRRDITDPSAGHRSIYSSSSSAHPTESKQQEIQLDLGTGTPHSLQFGFPDSPIFGPTSAIPTPSPLEQRVLPQATFESATARHVRTSTAPSELTASTAESDSERRSTGGYSTDYQSDTVYDSFPTRTTRSSSGKRGPPIDTIFDESPPSFSSGRSTKLRDLLNDGHFPGSEHSSRYRHSTIEEEGSVLSTPVRSLHDKSVTSTPSARPGAQQMYASSPPVRNLMSDLDEPDWDAMESPPSRDLGLGIQPTFGTPMSNQPPFRMAPFRLSALGRPSPGSVQSTPNRYSNGGIDKANLFDWSEQQPSPSHSKQSPPRPRTVHGKKDNESRGSRAAGRRPTSGMHARSHSVPVVPDVDGKRNVVANKFGTWGIGSKGPTEDWNEDFDFEEGPPPLPAAAAAILEEKRIDSGHEMFVPKSIREQQDSVVANISLLREWGLLIEELKDLRVRAVALNMLTGPHAKAWREVDAMIELADQESNEETLQPRRSPPSSPGFDSDAFDEPLPAVPEVSLAPHDDQMSVMSSTEDDVQHLSVRLSPSNSLIGHHTAARPRKDSEAVARSVIEALRSKRSVSDPTSLMPVAPTKKVPFDTATLRHIVPYVNGLKRKVKDALRETEGLYSSPRRRSPPDYDDDTDMEDAEHDHEPSFRSIFNEPGPNSPTRRRSRREDAATDNDGWDEAFEDPRTNLAARIQRMTLPPS